PYGGWPAGGEIDIMEYLGHVPNQVHGTIHSGGGELGHRFTGDDYVLQSGTFADDFHVFALEWEPRQMRWYVDGELYLTQVSWSSIGGPYPAPFDHPFHILMNVAVGGQWPGYPDETTTFPQQMLVDYVRVYQDTTAAPTVALEAPEDGLVIGAGDTLEIRASASSTGEITEVAFLQDGGVLGVATSAPYEISIGGLVDGCYVLRARATNAAGYVTTGDSVQVTVGGGCPPGSTAPYLMVPARIPGTIEAEYYDLGGSGVAYFDLSATNDGNGIRPNEGVDIRRSRDEGGGHDVTYPVAREWLQYTLDVEEAGSYRILARIASGSGGTVRLSLDDVDLLGDVSFSGTGGDATYGNAILGTVEFPAGRHTLRVEMWSAGFSLNRL